MNEKSVSTVRQVLKDQFKTGMPKITTRVFDGGYGSILIPGINYDPVKVGAQAQEIQDSLCRLEPQQLKGLIVDLRLNNGGNMHPMITGDDFNDLTKNAKVSAALRWLKDE
jgi:carboxyl-terminal processing protease